MLCCVLLYVQSQEPAPDSHDDLLLVGQNVDLSSTNVCKIT